MPLFRAKIFGSQLYTNSSTGTSTTTSTTIWQNKCTITTGTIPSGTYMLRWTIKGKFSAADKEYEFRIIDDSVTQLAYSQDRTPLAAVQKPWTSSRIFVLTEGIYTYTLQFRCVDAGTVTVSEANLEFWRLE